MLHESLPCAASDVSWRMFRAKNVFFVRHETILPPGGASRSTSLIFHLHISGFFFPFIIFFPCFWRHLHDTNLNHLNILISRIVACVSNVNLPKYFFYIYIKWSSLIDESYVIVIGPSCQTVRKVACTTWQQLFKKKTSRQ